MNANVQLLIIHYEFGCKLMQWKCWEPERCGLEEEVRSRFDMHILILCCLLFVWLLCVLALGCTAHSS